MVDEAVVKIAARPDPNQTLPDLHMSVEDRATFKLRTYTWNNRLEQYLSMDICDFAFTM